MQNPGVKCDVSECTYNSAGTTCQLDCIQVTHQKNAGDVVATPHFCQSYQKK